MHTSMINIYIHINMYMDMYILDMYIYINLCRYKHKKTKTTDACALNCCSSLSIEIGTVRVQIQIPRLGNSKPANPHWRKPLDSQQLFRAGSGVKGCLQSNFMRHVMMPQADLIYLAVQGTRLRGSKRLPCPSVLPSETGLAHL